MSDRPGLERISASLDLFESILADMIASGHRQDEIAVPEVLRAVPQTALLEDTLATVRRRRAEANI